MKHLGRIAGVAAIAAVTLSLPASADDLVKMTIGQRGNWDTAVPYLGDKAGIFKKHGITLEMVYTRGSGETVQPVISGNVDLGIAVGTLGAICMYSLNPKVIEDYAEFAKITPALAKRVRDEFFPKSILQLAEIKGLDDMLKDSVELKYAPKVLTAAEVKELVQTDIAK